jgi:type IV fimbrial biogenesis protein FimT
VLNAFPKTKSFGFSLVELMFGIAIMIILTTVAVPSFQTWLRNSQIRNAAESIANGLQRARAEAVARNTNVEFVLGTDGTASSWEVRVVSDPVPPIDSRSGNEGSRDVTRAVLPAGATTVAFNNFGGVVANVDRLTQVEVTAVGGDQKFQVEIVSAGGNARMCDCSLTLNSNPRACSIACPSS